jgi:hypothetical protein
VAGKPTTRTAGLEEGRVYVGRAHQYLKAAEDAAGRSNHDATVGNSVHAGIAAADAIASIRSGSRWVGEHGGAARHVEKAGEEGQNGAKQLRVLLPLKNLAEYDPTPATKTKAASALEAAIRAVAAADIAARQLPPLVQG